MIARGMLARVAMICVWVASTLGPGVVLADGLKKGPWLTAPTKTGIIVSWEASAPGPGHVEVTPTGGGDVILVDSSASGALHHVTVTGLSAQTKYEFSVFGGATKLGGGSFVSAPEPSGYFKFIVYGDNRSQNAEHQKIVDAIVSEAPFDFAINTGDMVSSGEVEADWQNYFEIEESLLKIAPLFPAIGNHEEDEGKAALFPKWFKVPPGGTETYYSFRWGATFFLVMDGHVEIDNVVICVLTQGLFEDCFNQKQLDFIKAELAKASADDTIDHVFISTHIGPYSSKPGRTGSAQMRALLDDLLANKTKVLFSGHDHYFEHGIAGNGLTYIITGGGGAPLYETKPELSLLFPHEVLTSESIHNYLVVEVAGQWVSVVAKDLNGKVITAFEIGTPPACIEAADCADAEPGPCKGSWSCNDTLQCQWLCDPPPKCVTAADCKDPQPEGTCDGAWACPAEACQWDCTQQAECSTNAECAGKPPLTDCPNGAWQCDANVCEWACPAPPKPDATDATDAADATDGTGATFEPTDQTGTGPGAADPGTEGTEGKPAATEGGTPLPPGNSNTNNSAGGGETSSCQAAGHGAPAGPAALALILTLLAWRARRIPT